MAKDRAVFSCDLYAVDNMPLHDVTDGSGRRVETCSRNVYADKGQQKKRKWSAFWQRYISSSSFNIDKKHDMSRFLMFSSISTIL